MPRATLPLSLLLVFLGVWFALAQETQPPPPPTQEQPAQPNPPEPAQPENQQPPEPTRPETPQTPGQPPAQPAQPGQPQAQPGQPGQPEAEPDFKTTAEIERRGKKIVVVKTGPDNPPVVIELRDLAGGAITALGAEKKTLKVGDKEFVTDGLTRFWNGANPAKFEDLKVGQQVRLETAEQNDGAVKAFDVRIGGKPEAERLTRSLFADPAPARVQITFGTDAKAFGAIARVTSIRDLNDFVTMTGGSARYVQEEDRLELSLRPAAKAVELQQGRSKSWGSRLEYDNQSGEARVSGPIEIERSGEKPLTGTSKDMIYNVDDEILRLFGEIKLVQDGRTSTAESAVVREKDRTAFLFGTREKPVKSTNKDGTVEGTRLQYNLDTGDVVVLEGVKGEFRDP